MTDLVDWAAEPAAIVDAVAASSEIHRTPCGDGTMTWRRWGQARHNAVPLVLLHGGSGSWTHWIKIIPRLAAEMEVWAADLPGLGDSAMPAPPHMPATSGRVVADGMRVLFSERPVHLLGFSFGAHVGTYAAADLGQRLASFTISGCAALGIPHNRLEFARERSNMTAHERDDVHRINLGRLMIAEQSRIDQLAVYIQAENVRRARFKSRAFASTGEIADTLPRVAAPLRAIWGARDVLATPTVEVRYDILRRSHPELRTRTIEDAGHWAAYEQPAAFAAAVRELIAGHI